MVEAFGVRDEFVVGTLLHQASALEAQNHIGSHRGSQVVGDVEDGLASSERIDVAEDGVSCDGVECSCGFVEDPGQRKERSKTGLRGLGSPQSALKSCN